MRGEPFSSKEKRGKEGSAAGQKIGRASRGWGTSLGRSATLPDHNRHYSNDAAYLYSNVPSSPLVTKHLPSARCNMCKAYCIAHTVGSAVPFFRGQFPSDQHLAPSSNLVLSRPGSIDMNNRRLKRNVPPQRLHRCAHPVTILGRHVHEQTKHLTRSSAVSNQGCDQDPARLRQAMKWRGCKPNRMLPLLAENYWRRWECKQVAS